MSEPQIILVPVQGQNNGQPLQVGLADPNQFPKIAQNLQHQNDPVRQNGEINSQAVGEEDMANDSSLVKQVTSDPSILYSFINWENPGKTFASFIIIMSLIISTRYFSPLQWILKVLCTILGVTSLIEVIGRVATNDGIMARVRPQSYYRPSDSTYSRLFSEIQETVDITSIKLQRVIFAEDLQGPIIGFALTFTAYWLIKTIPPFWLAIVTMMLTYTLGPILTGPHSVSIKPTIDQKARNLKDRAVNTASSATNHTANKAQELGSLAMDTASSASDNAAAKARDIKDRTVESATHTTDHTTGKAQELKSRTMETTYSATGNTKPVGNGTGTQYAINHKSAPPNALGFDDNNISRDRRTQVHPLASEIRNTAM